MIRYCLFSVPEVPVSVISNITFFLYLVMMIQEVAGFFSKKQDWGLKGKSSFVSKYCERLLRFISCRRFYSDLCHLFHPPPCLFLIMESYSIIRVPLIFTYCLAPSIGNVGNLLQVCILMYEGFAFPFLWSFGVLTFMLGTV